MRDTHIKDYDMKFRTAILATALVAAASSYAFAQVPTERTGSKTEQGTQIQQNNKAKINTTGAGVNATMTTDTPPRNNPNGTPASPNVDKK